MGDVLWPSVSSFDSRLVRCNIIQLHSIQSDINVISYSASYKSGAPKNRVSKVLNAARRGFNCVLIKLGVPSTSLNMYVRTLIPGGRRLWFNSNLMVPYIEGTRCRVFAAYGTNTTNAEHPCRCPNSNLNVQHAR